MGIQTVRQRNALKPRREPFWHPMGTGQHLGYRRTTDGGAWILRAYDSGTRSRTYHALGDLAHVTGADQFTAATKLAREWFEHLGKGGSSTVLTVRQACETYVKACRKRSTAAGDDAEGRFDRHVYTDPIAGIALQKLSFRNVKAWRERLEAKPATNPMRGPRCRSTNPPAPPRQRAASGVNRDMVALRAALNLALSENYVLSDAAWRVPLKPTKGAGRRRTLYLDRKQRRALIDALPADAGDFVRGLCMLPLRPGALASLMVRDFDSRAGTLSIHHDKAGEGRAILLPPAMVAMLRKQAKSKLPMAPLFARSGGGAWNKDAWKVPIAAAATAAKLPAGATAYTLRHSTITDLVQGGLDLLTIAQVSGTSVVMIEKHYGHLRKDRARDALAGLAL